MKKAKIGWLASLQYRSGGIEGVSKAQCSTMWLTSLLSFEGQAVLNWSMYDGADLHDI